MFFFKQKTAYEMRISDWSSDVCSSDLIALAREGKREFLAQAQPPGHVGDHLHAHLLGEMIEIDVAALVNALSHIDGAMAAAFPAVETTFASAGRASEIGRASRRERMCQYVSI